MATFSTANFVTPILDALFRNTSGYSTSTPPLSSFAAYAGGTNTHVASTLSWGTPSDGVMVCATTAMSWLQAGTITDGRLYGQLTTNGSPAITLSQGLVGSGAEVILSGVGGAGVSIVNLRVKIPRTFGTASLNTAARNAICEILRGGANQSWAVADLAKAAYGETANACTLTLYGGAVPSDADQPAGTVLGSYTVPDVTNLMAAASGGTIGLASPIAVPITGTGTITHFRLTKTSSTYGTLVFQGTAGTSGTDAIVSSTTASGSGTIDLTALNFTLVP